MLKMLEPDAKDVELEMLDWLVAVQQVKDVWKFARLMFGEPFVMISGAPMMPQLSVGSLASQQLEPLHAHEPSLELVQATYSLMMFSVLVLKLDSPTAKLAPPTTVYTVRMLE